MISTSYVYRDFYKESGCYTVGFYNPDGNWEPESDWPTRKEAEDRVHYLNGGEGNAE